MIFRGPQINPHPSPLDQGQIYVTHRDPAVFLFKKRLKNPQPCGSARWAKLYSSPSVDEMWAEGALHAAGRSGNCSLRGDDSLSLPRKVGGAPACALAPGNVHKGGTGGCVRQSWQTQSLGRSGTMTLGGFQAISNPPRKTAHISTWLDSGVSQSAWELLTNTQRVPV